MKRALTASLTTLLITSTAFASSAPAFASSAHTGRLPAPVVKRCIFEPHIVHRGWKIECINGQWVWVKDTPVPTIANGNRTK
jgi:hypothetical protein